MVRDRIASEPPEHTNMLDTRSDAGCETAYCIAGWAQVIRRGRYEGSALFDSKDWLELSRGQAARLFLPDCMDELTQADALVALDSLINATDDDALPVWPERVS